ncbi:hypothetical protein L6P87_32815, partial [Klebsiella pneumoniae]|nr:hypothetical protein [Klebsiella pneumoniae]
DRLPRGGLPGGPGDAGEGRASVGRITTRGYPPGHAPQKRRIAPLALFALRQAKWLLRRRRPAPGRAKIRR